MNPIHTLILVITFKYHVEPFLVLSAAMLVSHGPICDRLFSPSLTDC